MFKPADIKIAYNLLKITYIQNQRRKGNNYEKTYIGQEVSVLRTNIRNKTKKNETTLTNHILDASH